MLHRCIEHFIAQVLKLPCQLLGARALLDLEWVASRRVAVAAPDQLEVG